MKMPNFSFIFYPNVPIYKNRTPRVCWFPCQYGQITKLSREVVALSRPSCHLNFLKKRFNEFARKEISKLKTTIKAKTCIWEKHNFVMTTTNFGSSPIGTALEASFDPSPFTSFLIKQSIVTNILWIKFKLYLEQNRLT